MSVGVTESIAQIVAQASERLALLPEGGARGELIESLRRFMRLETERLRMRHRIGLGGDEIVAGRSQQVDLLCRRVCQWMAAELGPQAQAELVDVALVALGGYGREELAPFSDIDLLFLRAHESNRTVQSLVEGVLAMLWDIGFTVGHSFRSIAECVDIARGDLHARTAMAEARFLTGNAELYASFVGRLHEAVFQNASDTEAFISALRHETEARYERYGRSVGLLEPHIKEGAGGLRDLHSLSWLAHARFGEGRLERLLAGGQLSEREFKALWRARGFLARVRNEAHFLTGRKTDRLTLDLQTEMATHLGYVHTRQRSTSEELMRDYYERADDLHAVFTSFAVRNGLFARRRPSPWRRLFARRRRHFEVHAGALHLPRDTREDQGAPSSPRLTLEAFAMMQAAGVDLSDEVKVAIRGGLVSIDARFRASRETGKALLGILAQTGRVSRALRAMHSTGFLGRLLPEWSRLTFLAQHDHYHTYTVDEHTLRALELLDEVATSDDPALQSFRRLLEETPEPEILYLALLLHDIGKGRGVSHVPMGARLAERICRQLHLRSEAAQEVVFLVRQHLLMSQLSQRRDLSEESVLQGFVAKVADLPRLNRLMLLTYVDHRAVGPNVWNDWKASLLWDLYKQARVLVAGGEPARWDEDRRLRARQRLVQALMPRVAASLIERHLALMPDKYLRTIDAERLEMHLGLIERLGLQPVTTHWHPAPLGHSTELTVCTRDARGLLARLSGTLSAHGLDILSVDLFTREDGFVLDTFRVRARGGQQAVAARLWRAIDDDLTGALRGDYDVPRAIAAWREKNPPQAARRAARRHASPKISFDCEASPDNTVVEVEAEDQPGLVYTIAHTLSLLGMNITFAKIATEKSHALDVFYLTGARGAKLTLTEMESVSNALRQALTGPRAPQGVSSKEDR